MRITSLEIERFGIWEHLQLPDVSPGLNIFYGPNETGKTTLMQFIRSCLYGCGGDERIRYIQMVLDSRTHAQRRSGTPVTDNRSDNPDYWVGGTMTVDSGLGKHRLARRYLHRNTSLYDRQTALEMKSGFVATGGLAAWSGRFYPLPGKGIAESVIVSGPDGARLSDYFVNTLVNNVDESTFNNVFAIGLDELQRLGTLNETDAAQMLYRLSVGVDRVSLVQVLHQLNDERNQIFDAHGKSSIMESLLAKREKLVQRSLEPGLHLREYSRISVESREVKEAIRILQEKLDKNRQQKRVYEIALSVGPIWDRRDIVRHEISQMGKVSAVEESLLDQSNIFAGSIRQTRSELQTLKLDYLKLKKEIAALAPNKAIVANAPRVELLVEELPRLERINKEIHLLKEELTEQETQLANEELRLKGAKKGKIYLTRFAIDSIINQTTEGEPANEPLPAQDVDRLFTAVAQETAIKEVEDYKIPARNISRAQKKYQRFHEELVQVQEQLQNTASKLESGLTSQGQRNLTEAVNQTNELIVALRRRNELGHRLNDLGQSRKELEHQNAFLTNNLSLQTGALLTVGLVVIAGGLMFGFALFQLLEFSLGVLGILMALGGFIYKSTVERRNYSRLEENQRQLGQLLKQLEQLKQEAQVIDNRYPAPGQPIDIRLQKAHSDLLYFEKMLPLDLQWRELNNQQQLLERRVEKAQETLKTAKHRWEQWLKVAGLPKTLKPSQIRELLSRVDIIEELRIKIDGLRNNLELCRRERRGICDQLDRVLLEVPLPNGHDRSPVASIPYLKERLRDCRAKEASIGEKGKALTSLLKQRQKLRNQERKEHREWLEFLHPYGATNEEELRDLAARYKEYLQKTDQLKNLQNKIDSEIASFCPEETIAKLLNDPQVRPTIAELLENVIRRVESRTDEQRGKKEHLARLEEQLAVLAGRKDGLRCQFDSATLETRLEEMATLWQSRAISCRMMEEIRKAYERERQPETLREASRFIETLTDGKYIKIWTPLGEDTLFVDTGSGETFDVGDLSRGTREQLFIAIRLALVLSFEKHGIQLPLILDDVFVNFDNKRALAAAKLLHELAQSGRQIFIFTCHEHICRIFLDMETPIHILPAREDKDRQIRVVYPSEDADQSPLKVITKRSRFRSSRSEDSLYQPEPVIISDQVIPDLSMTGRRTASIHPIQNESVIVAEPISQVETHFVFEQAITTDFPFAEEEMFSDAEELPFIDTPHNPPDIHLYPHQDAPDAPHIVVDPPGWQESVFVERPEDYPDETDDFDDPIDSDEDYTEDSDFESEEAPFDENEDDNKDSFGQYLSE